MIPKLLKDTFGPQKSQTMMTQQYQKWRELIFEIDPGQVGVSKEQSDRVYGVLMDIGMVDRQSRHPFALSLTAFPTGETSFQPTVGGGIIGLGGDKKMAEIARKLIQLAQPLLDKTQPAKDFSLPASGFVQFFFFTPHGVRIYEEHLDTLQTAGNPFGQLLVGFGIIRQFAERIIDQQRARK